MTQELSASSPAAERLGAIIQRILMPNAPSSIKMPINS